MAAILNIKTVRIKLLFNLFLRVHTKVALNEILLASEHRKRHKKLTKSGGHRGHTYRGVHIKTEITQNADC